MLKHNNRFRFITAIVLITVLLFSFSVFTAAEENGDSIIGRWERFGDGAEGTIVKVSKVGTNYQAVLENVTGTLVELAFAKGDQKWKDIIFSGDGNYKGFDMFRFESGGYEYRESNLKINAQGILEVSVKNNTETSTIIGTYQTWRKLDTVTAAVKNTIVLYIGNQFMKVNGQDKEIDPGRGTVPVIVNDRTMLPISSLIKEFGGTVAWVGTEKKVTITLNSKTIDLWIGRNTTMVNGTERLTDVAPQIVNDRTMLPLRFIIDNFGYDVVWNPANRSVTVKY